MATKTAFICTIRIVVISISMLAMTSRVNAQYNADSTHYAKKAQRALATKRFGAALTILGTAAFIAGGILMSDDLDNGAAVGMAGLVGTVIGIPIWIVGGVNHKKFTRKAQALTVQINATPQSQGLTLRYRF